MRGARPSAAVTGLTGVPWWGLMPMPEKANSVICVRPIRAAPAARRRATARASVVAAGRSASTMEPAVVVCPATSNRSLMLTARPSSGPVAAPRWRRWSDASAAARAPSQSMCTKADAASPRAMSSEMSRVSRAAWAGEMGAARGRTGSMGFKAATISGFFRCRFHSGELSGAWCARQTRCTGRKNQSRIRLAEGVAPSAVLTVHCVQFESDSRSNLWNFWS